MDTNAPTTTTTTTSTTSSWSNVNYLAQQNMDYPQNAYFPVYGYGPLAFPATPSPAPPTQYCYPAPYFAPCNQSVQFPYMNSFQQVNHPIAHPMGQSVVQFGMPNWQPRAFFHDEERKMEGAWMSKIARDKRKQARQRSRSSTSGASASASAIPEEPREKVPSREEANVQENVSESIISCTLCSPDGKMLRGILTKKLKSCDVGSLGRIVLPKREAEKNLPALHNKEGIQVLVKDVYSDQQWNLKFKYWTNNNSRMYVLEDTGNLVKYYELQVGDSVTFYEDEQKNLYVSVEKEQRPEVAEPPSTSREGQQPHGTYSSSYVHRPYTHQAKDEEEEASLALLIEELSHNEQEAANSLLSLCSG